MPNNVKAYHFTLDLTGSIQRLTSSPVGGVRWLSLQPGAANANPVYLGGEGMTSVDYGVRLPASVAGEPSAPHIIAEFDDGSVGLQDIWVLGTAGQKLHVHVFFVYLAY